jgi:CxxC-x17-CxxC domain-containing protein
VSDSANYSTSHRRTNVSYSDQTLTCRDCGTQFVFTAGEQEFHASKGFTNAPGRCPDCRAQRKAERGGGYSSGGYSSGGYSSGGYSVGDRVGYGGGGGYDRPRRQMYPATCAQCGKETEVPFQPTGIKPVYCSDCFQSQRSYR